MYYRASALGGCKRMLALARQGFDPVPPPPEMQKIYEAGHEAERQAWAKGILKGLAQQYVELIISDNIRVSGHLDSWSPVYAATIHPGRGGSRRLAAPVGAEGGRASERTQRVGAVELKSVTTDGMDVPLTDLPLWPRYSFQVSCYMLATGAELDLVRVLRDGAGNISDQKVDHFTEPPVSLAAIRQRVLEVELLARKDLADVDCDRLEYPCPFFYTHRQRDSREQISDDDALVLTQQFVNARAQAKLADARVKAARTALVEWLGDRSKIVLNNRYRITRADVKAKPVSYTRSAYTSIIVTEVKEDHGKAPPSADDTSPSG